MSERLKQRVTEILLQDGVAESFFLHEDPRVIWVDGAFVVDDANYGDWKSIGAYLLYSYGGEGQGDQYWSVWKFTEGDEYVMVKFDGWYASYHGSEYEDWWFVEPKQKTVTVYE